MSGESQQAVDALRQRAARLPHAIVRSVTIFPDGRIGEETSLHYLSCLRCEIERLADEVDGLGQGDGQELEIAKNR